MSIFVHPNAKSDLQKKLDREQDQQHQSACCQEQHECCGHQEPKPLFQGKGKPNAQTKFAAGHVKP